MLVFELGEIFSRSAISGKRMISVAGHNVNNDYEIWVKWLLLENEYYDILTIR